MNHIEPIKPPCADGIKVLRAEIGATQARCAKMAQVSLITWKQWESGLRTPSLPSWGIFLLAIDQHPDFTIIRRAVNA